MTPRNFAAEDWVWYRLVVARIVLFTELDQLSIIDIANLNEALDLKLAVEGEIEIIPEEEFE